MLALCPVTLCWHLLVRTGSNPCGTFIFNFLSVISVGNLTLQIRPPKLSILIAYHWKTKMLGSVNRTKTALLLSSASSAHPAASQAKLTVWSQRGWEDLGRPFSFTNLNVCTSLSQIKTFVLEADVGRLLTIEAAHAASPQSQCVAAVCFASLKASATCLRVTQYSLLNWKHDWTWEASFIVSNMKCKEFCDCTNDLNAILKKFCN